MEKNIYEKKTAIGNHIVSLSKVCYWEENIRKQIEFLTVFLSMPLNKLPWMPQIDSIFSLRKANVNLILPCQIDIRNDVATCISNWKFMQRRLLSSGKYQKMTKAVCFTIGQSRTICYEKVFLKEYLSAFQFYLSVFLDIHRNPKEK